MLLVTGPDNQEYNGKRAWLKGTVVGSLFFFIRHSLCMSRPIRCTTSASPWKMTSFPSIITSNSHFGTNSAESYSTKRSALMTHNGYCKSRKRTGGVCSIFSIRHAVKANLLPCSACLETLITSPVLSCVCVGADAGASVLLCSCFRTASVCGNPGAPLSPVRHRGALVNVFHFAHGDRYLVLFASSQ